MTAAGESAVSATGPAIDAAARAAEVARRIGIVQGLGRDRGRDAVLLTTRRNVSWLTIGGSFHVVAGGDATAVPILVHAGGATAIAPNNESDRVADEELAGLPLDATTVPWHDDAARDAEIRRRVGGDGGRSPATDADVETGLRPIRSTLAPIEADRLAWLGGRVSAAMGATLAGVTPGTSEDEAAARLVGTLAADGIRSPVVLAAADERIARYRHPLPGPTPVRDRLMLIIVGERWGLHAALTRFCELRPPAPDIRDRLEACEAILAEMNAASIPGATFGDVFATAVAAYRRAGHPDEWRLHHQGGSIGYAPREAIAVPADRTPIVARMAFAWNPSIRGAKAESTMITAADGQRIVATSDPDRHRTASRA